jgi:hypothetical protein
MKIDRIVPIMVCLGSLLGVSLRSDAARLYPHSLVVSNLREYPPRAVVQEDRPALGPTPTPVSVPAPTPTPCPFQQPEFYGLGQSADGYRVQADITVGDNFQCSRDCFTAEYLKQDRNGSQWVPVPRDSYDEQSMNELDVLFLPDVGYGKLPTEVFQLPPEKYLNLVFGRLVNQFRFTDRQDHATVDPLYDFQTSSVDYLRADKIQMLVDPDQIVAELNATNHAALVPVSLQTWLGSSMARTRIAVIVRWYPTPISQAYLSPMLKNLDASAKHRLFVINLGRSTAPPDLQDPFSGDQYFEVQQPQSLSNEGWFANSIATELVPFRQKVDSLRRKFHVAFKIPSPIDGVRSQNPRVRILPIVNREAFIAGCGVSDLTSKADANQPVPFLLIFMKCLMSFLITFAILPLSIECVRLLSRRITLD